MNAYPTSDDVVTIFVDRHYHTQSDHKCNYHPEEATELANQRCNIQVIILPVVL